MFKNRLNSRSSPQRGFTLLELLVVLAHHVTDQSSILRFIEDNWNLGRVGGGSFDAKAGSLEGMFDFHRAPRMTPVILDPTTGTRAGQSHDADADDHS